MSPRYKAKANRCRWLSTGSRTVRLVCSPRSRGFFPVHDFGNIEAGFECRGKWLMAKVGSLDWELRTGGRLSPLERLKMIAAAIRLQLLNHARRRRKPGQAMRQLTELNLDAIWIPDTTTAREALEACATVSLPALFNRSDYLF